MQGHRSSPRGGKTTIRTAPPKDNRGATLVAESLLDNPFIGAFASVSRKYQLICPKAVYSIPAGNMTPDRRWEISKNATSTAAAEITDRWIFHLRTKRKYANVHSGVAIM